MSPVFAVKTWAENSNRLARYGFLYFRFACFHGEIARFSTAPTGGWILVRFAMEDGAG